MLLYKHFFKINYLNNFFFILKKKNIIIFNKNFIKNNTQNFLNFYRNKQLFIFLNFLEIYNLFFFFKKDFTYSNNIYILENFFFFLKKKIILFYTILFNFLFKNKNSNINIFLKKIKIKNNFFNKKKNSLDFFFTNLNFLEKELLDFFKNSFYKNKFNIFFFKKKDTRNLILNYSLKNKIYYKYNYKVINNKVSLKYSNFFKKITILKKKKINF